MTRRKPAAKMRGRERAIAIVTGTVALSASLSAVLVAVALGASTLTISSAASPQLGKQVAVNPQGRTLYTLSGESRTHQICTSAECLKFWPPLRVSSRATKLKAGSGVHGKLGIISRSGGLFQVTLNGVPLYRFSGDKAKGQANGEGIVFPGGHVWHAVVASSAKHTTTQPAPTPAAKPAPMPTPTYPGY
jgi:predicted lipoprotein with Yx(FWY)xxD motif